MKSNFTNKPLSNISYYLNSIRANSYHNVSLAIFSDKPNKTFLSCYGSFSEHIQWNLKDANIMNPDYDKCKIHAIEISTSINNSDPKISFKHLLIDHLSPLSCKSTPISIFNKLTGSR